MNTMDDTTGLQSKIESWLSSQGYPLEMRTAQVFMARQFDTRQSEYYMDFDSGETRETDVVVSRDANIANVMVRLSLVIECKAATDKPWILFSSGNDQLPDTTRVFQRPASQAGLKALLILMRHPEVCNAPLFMMGANSGYALVQGLRSEKDDRVDVGYKALGSVTHAACSMALRSDKIDQRTKRIVSVLPNFAHILFPTLIIGGTLWRCALKPGDTTKVDVQQIDRGVLAWKNPIFGHAHTLVHIITKDNLEAFANDAAATFTTVKTICEGAGKTGIAGIPAQFAERRRASGVVEI